MADGEVVVSFFFFFFVFVVFSSLVPSLALASSWATKKKGKKVPLPEDSISSICWPNLPRVRQKQVHEKARQYFTVSSAHVIVDNQT